MFKAFDNVAMAWKAIIPTIAVLHWGDDKENSMVLL